MSASICPCGEPAPDAFLGKRCALRLERALGDLPALIADLDITLARQAVTGAHSPDGGKPPKKDAQPLPFHKKAGDVRADLRHTLVTAVRHLTEARGITEGPADNTLAMARWLLRYSDSIRLDPAGGRFLASHSAIAGYVFPNDEDITPKRLAAWLDEIASLKLVTVYTCGRVRYGAIPKYRRHQRISHPTPSTLPVPPTDMLFEE